MVKILVISDTHDREAELKRLIQEINKTKEAEMLIHCGDFCAPFMIKALGEFSGEVHCVFGNTDDRWASTILASKRGINLHGDLGEIEVDKRKIAIIHNDRLGELLAETGKFDAVFHGHDHKAYKKKVNNTLLANPGDLSGVSGTFSYAIYDTETNEIEHKEFK